MLARLSWTRALISRWRRNRLDNLTAEHEALEELYEDSDLSAAWRSSLLSFTASHLERHHLNRSQRRTLKDALRSDRGMALPALETLHNAAHGGAYDIAHRVATRRNG